MAGSAFGLLPSKGAGAAATGSGAAAPFIRNSGRSKKAREGSPGACAAAAAGAFVAVASTCGACEEDALVLSDDLALDGRTVGDTERSGLRPDGCLTATHDER